MTVRVGALLAAALAAGCAAAADFRATFEGLVVDFNCEGQKERADQSREPVTIRLEGSFKALR